MSFDAGSRFVFSGPPRWIPLFVRLRLWFGGSANQIGWALIAIGTLACWALGVPPLLQKLAALQGALTTADATVLTAEPMNARENNVQIWKYHFQFTLADKQYEADSYETGNTLTAGAHAVVEYPEHRPEIARIRGMRLSLFGWPIVFLLLLPVVGLLLIIFGGRKYRRAGKLLTHGIQSTARLVTSEPTNSSVNKQRVYKMTFNYQTQDSETHQLVVRTHETRALQDESEEPLLYDPHNPDRALLLDQLPGHPRVDEMGEIRLTQPIRTYLCLFFPLVALIGNSIYAYLTYLS